MNPVQALRNQGQSVWLDFLARGFIAKGDLKKLVDEDGVAGVTSNPAIFEKAIADSDDYDEAISSMLAASDRSVGDIYESLAIEDIKHAADVLRPVFDRTGGSDGFVSIEVSPYLATDTRASIAEARRLWSEIDRKNLMVKIPATPAGLPAIQALIAEAINVNITLLFSQDVYEQVVEAYLAGLEALAGNGRDPSQVASVASFFVSRIDTAVDKLLDEKIAKANDPDEKARLGKLKGKTAIENAKLAYQRYQRRFEGARWDGLRAKGAKPQRLLWASTGTKNKAYSDVLYVEELIGRNTVNTMPPATLDAFRDHGRVRETLTQDIDEARAILSDIERAGISLRAVTEDKLVNEGVQLFADAADKLLSALAKKRTQILGERIGKQTIALGGKLADLVSETTDEWRAKGNIRRLFRRDKSLWTNADEDKWLDWLDCADRKDSAEFTDFAREIASEGFSDALLLGMGGSSLGPEVLAETFRHNAPFPKLRILDSTDPAQIRAAESAVNLERTLFIVSSKSGSTTEPNTLADYFFDRLVQSAGSDKAGRSFIAITDPGSTLERSAKARNFRRIFHGVPGIGGRYSVLSPFGLVPAAVAGIDIARMLELTRLMVRSCGPDVPPSDNPGAALGIALGIAGANGRDKVTIIVSPRLAAFGAWAEQLIAESTGKEGKGLIPVDSERLGRPEIYGPDRFFIDLQTEQEGDSEHEARLTALEKAQHPVARIRLESIDQIGQEFFRFEIATAVAGAVLGINPFDQPDVEASKQKTRALTAAFEETGALPQESPVCSTNGMDLYTDATNAAALRKAGMDDQKIEDWLKAHLTRIRSGDYFAVLAYLARNKQNLELLQRLRLIVRDRKQTATCLGFGPRFLHSTGQAYKGGPNTGVFLQITAGHENDLKIPGHRASFGIVEAAQARGDFDVLTERGRRAVRLHLKGNVSSGLSELSTIIGRALA